MKLPAQPSYKVGPERLLAYGLVYLGASDSRRCLCASPSEYNSDMKRKLLQSFNTLKSHICLGYRTIFMNEFRSTIVDASEGPYDPIVATQTNNPTLQQDHDMETDGGAAVDDIIFKIAKRSIGSDAMGTNGGPGHEDNRTRSMYAHRRSVFVHCSLPMEPSHERKIRKMRQRALYNKQHADADEAPPV